jgi:hypothetical protein
MKETNKNIRFDVTDKMKRMVINDCLLKGKNGQRTKRHGISLIKLIRHSILADKTGSYDK